MEGYLGIVVLVFVALIIFIIYFNVKVLQFVIQAINLYKKMVIRQDAMIHLLVDIRDNTKNYDKISKELDEADDIISKGSQAELKICEKCKTQVPVIYKRCPKCGNNFE
jgi:hypothetical protein